jgi:hypothetical protein
MGKRSSQVGSDGSVKKWSHVSAMTASSLRECWRESELKITCSLGIWNNAPLNVYEKLNIYQETIFHEELAHTYQ